MSRLSKLLEISESASSATTGLDYSFIPKILHPIYLEKNGLIALEGALVAYPANEDSGFCLLDINEKSLWKHEYSNDVVKTFFFARDLFGHQYGVLNDCFYKLNQESGKLEFHSGGLEEWADKILSNYDYETGWSLGHEWQVRSKTHIRSDECLLPLRPFAMGGEFEVDNLVKVPLRIAMRKYADLYRQVKSLIPGEGVSIEWDPQELH